MTPSPALLAAIALAGAGRHPLQERHGPPGLVFVAGGKTPVGTPAEEAVALAEKGRAFLGNLAGEQPQTVVPVGDFWIQASEVTNEQYEVFVRATGRRPPVHWADPDALDRARRGFLAKPPDPREHHRKWDPAAWWREKWREIEWSVPAEIARKPVVHVSADDAGEYARWAGLRLPTESEWTRAARGSDGTIAYPWGPDWRREACANLENAERRGGEPQAPWIGSHPEGASLAGVHDLVGSVWEWTSSPYRPFPGYRPLAIRAAVRGLPAEKVEAPFGMGGRVALGGSFRTSSPSLACRVSSRAGPDPSDTAPDLGFRCAWTPLPGRDSLLAAADAERVALAGVELAFDRTLGIERWETAPADPADLAIASGPGRESRPAPAARGWVPGYAAIASHGAVAFAPVRRVDFVGGEALRRAARDRPVLLGLLLIDVPLVEPPLPPGLYAVSFHGKGGKAGGRDPHEDPKRDRIVFRGVGHPTSASAEAQAPVEMRDLPVALAGGKSVDPEKGEIALEFGVVTKGEWSALRFALRLRCDRGRLDGPWVR
ncbi:MAG TPA: SUMF1/EgtB/PvdO family nonheme iron enzyme [Planctomycetota bacterium]|jgi:iron(II)-dependent oxidoreductase|nr:SUMF1/EgtB/PvdO family nonheme iron enzyme [Planctomycetota bacterium]